MAKHKWKTDGSGQICELCGLKRVRPQSRIRRGRKAVGDWDYWIGQTWVRKQTVPPCEPKAPEKPGMSDHEKREVASEGLLMAQAASEIKAQDCAAYSVLAFNEGQVEEPWQTLGVQAFRKFSVFGWTAFHALGGLNVDWAKAAETILAKLKAGFPKKPAKQS